MAALRRTAVDHNIRLMHRLGREQLFANILEAARSEKQPRPAPGLCLHL